MQSFVTGALAPVFLSLLFLMLVFNVEFFVTFVISRCEKRQICQLFYVDKGNGLERDDGSSDG